MDIREAIIGMEVETARKLLQEQGMIMRVTSEDGESYIVTCDYRTDRLNVAVVDGKVTGISGVG